MPKKRQKLKYDKNKCILFVAYSMWNTRVRCEIDVCLLSVHSFRFQNIMFLIIMSFQSMNMPQKKVSMCLYKNAPVFFCVHSVWTKLTESLDNIIILNNFHIVRDLNVLFSVHWWIKFILNSILRCSPLVNRMKCINYQWSLIGIWAALVLNNRQKIIKKKLMKRICLILVCFSCWCDWGFYEFDIVV